MPDLPPPTSPPDEGPSPFDPAGDAYGRAASAPSEAAPAPPPRPASRPVVKVAVARSAGRGPAAPAAEDPTPRDRARRAGAGGDGWAGSDPEARSGGRAGRRAPADGRAGLSGVAVDDVVAYGEPVDIFDGRGLANLLYFRSARPGMMPAGMVLAIVLCGMLVAMMVNADATLRKSNSKCNDCWRHAVAEAVAYTSNLIHATAPRQALDRARNGGKEPDTGTGTGTDQGLDSSEIARQAEADRIAAGGGVAAGPSGTVAVAAAAKPAIRKPVATAPLHLWVGGDSIVGAFGPALQKVVSDTGLFTAVSDARPSTGLTRRDYYNWPKHLYDDVVHGGSPPDVMVIMFGSNDVQGMPLRGNQGYAELTPEWLQEYRQRVHDTMKSLRGKDDDRLVIWMGAPKTGNARLERGLERLNYIYWSEAQKFPYIVYFDTPAFLSNPDGSYAASLPNADGKVQLLRASDNIHLNQAGADRVAWAVLNKLSGSVDLSAASLVQPPDKVAPPTVKERPEVPRPADWPDSADQINE